MINNLAQFKRAMKVGVKVEFTCGLKEVGNRPVVSYVVRTCKKAQSNAFALDNHPYAIEEGALSWLYYPKAKDIKFKNGIMYVESNGAKLTYKILN